MVLTFDLWSLFFVVVVSFFVNILYSAFGRALLLYCLLVASKTNQPYSVDTYFKQQIFWHFSTNIYK